MYFFYMRSIGIWCNPKDKSKAEKNLAFPNCDSMSSMSGSGCASWSVSSLSFVISITILHLCFPEASCFFGTALTGELYGESEGFIMFFLSISPICRLISVLWHSGIGRI